LSLGCDDPKDKRSAFHRNFGTVYQNVRRLVMKSLIIVAGEETRISQIVTLPIAKYSLSLCFWSLSFSLIALFSNALSISLVVPIDGEKFSSICTRGDK